jgi:hypothetical protein
LIVTHVPPDIGPELGVAEATVKPQPVLHDPLQHCSPAEHA